MKEQKDNNLKTSSMTTNNSVGKLEISDNVHPNLDGSPWGWIQIAGTKIRVATYSGREEKERCKELVKVFNAQPLSPQSAEGVDAEKILAKHSKNYKKTVEQDEKPLYYLVVNGHEAINAMTEYSQLKGKEKDEEYKKNELLFAYANNAYQNEIENLNQLLSEKEKEIEYWKQRCEAAEDVFYRESFPGEPAWEKWQQLKSQEPTSPQNNSLS